MKGITFHFFDVPRKDNPAVKGVEPGKVMPIPYTNACGGIRIYPDENSPGAKRYRTKRHP